MIDRQQGSDGGPQSPPSLHPTGLVVKSSWPTSSFWDTDKRWKMTHNPPCSSNYKPLIIRSLMVRFILSPPPPVRYLTLSITISLENNSKSSNRIGNLLDSFFCCREALDCKSQGYYFLSGRIFPNLHLNLHKLLCWAGSGNIDDSWREREKKTTFKLSLERLFRCSIFAVLEFFFPTPFQDRQCQWRHKFITTLSHAFISEPYSSRSDLLPLIEFSDLNQ